MIFSSAKVKKYEGGNTCVENCQLFNKKLASYSYRTATTAYPCYIPVLGGSAGAGRIRLARAAKVIRNRFSAKRFKENLTGRTKLTFLLILLSTFYDVYHIHTAGILVFS